MSREGTKRKKEKSERREKVSGMTSGNHIFMISEYFRDYFYYFCTFCFFFHFPFHSSHYSLSLFFIFLFHFFYKNVTLSLRGDTHHGTGKGDHYHFQSYVTFDARNSFRISSGRRKK